LVVGVEAGLKPSSHRWSDGGPFGSMSHISPQFMAIVLGIVSQARLKSILVVLRKQVASLCSNDTIGYKHPRRCWGRPEEPSQQVWLMTRSLCQRITRPLTTYDRLTASPKVDWKAWMCRVDVPGWSQSEVRRALIGPCARPSKGSTYRDAGPWTGHSLLGRSQPDVRRNEGCQFDKRESTKNHGRWLKRDTTWEQRKERHRPQHARSNKKDFSIALTDIR